MAQQRIISDTVITGSLTVTRGITGSFSGTATSASYAVSSSYATSASFATSASWSQTASFVTNAVENRTVTATETISASLFSRMVIRVTGLTNNVVLTLPAPTFAGQSLTIIDSIGLFSYTKQLTIKPDSGHSIYVPLLGSCTTLLACVNNASISLIADGSATWQVVSNKGWVKDISGIANMISWWDVRRGVTLSGSAVSQISDQSGGTVHAIQTSSAQQPVYSAADTELDGHPVLTFDGTRQFNNVTWTTDAAGLTVFVVIKPNNIAAYHNIYEYTGLVAPQFWVQTSGKLELNGANGVPYSINNNWQVVTTISRTTGNETEMRVNGHTAIIVASGIGTIAASAAYSVFNRGSASRFQGKFAELIVFGRALTETEVIQTERYLLEKFGR